MIKKEYHNTKIQNAMIDCLNRQLKDDKEDDFILKGIPEEHLLLFGEFINSFYIRGGKND